MWRQWECQLQPTSTGSHAGTHSPAQKDPGSWTHKPSCTRVPQPEPRKGPWVALSRHLPPHALSTRGPGFALAQRSSALLQGSPVGLSASPGPPLTALPGGPGQDGSPSWGGGTQRRKSQAEAHAGAAGTGGGAQAEVPPAGGCEPAERRGLSGGVQASGQAVQVRRMPSAALGMRAMESHSANV